MQTVGYNRSRRKHVVWSSHSVGLSFLLCSCLGIGTGCVRDALDYGCDPTATPQLVITEVRSGQDDPYGEWIELFNAGDTPVLLEDLSLETIDTASDSELADVKTRRTRIFTSDTTLEPGEYAIIGSTGSQISGLLAASYAGRVETSSSADGSVLMDAKVGSLDIYQCGSLIDRIKYIHPPTGGTIILDGALDPSDTDNGFDPAMPVDQNFGLPAAWCIDSRAQAVPGVEEPYATGSPGEPNPVCADLPPVDDSESE